MSCPFAFFTVSETAGERHGTIHPVFDDRLARIAVAADPVREHPFVAHDVPLGTRSIYSDLASRAEVRICHGKARLDAFLNDDLSRQAVLIRTGSHGRVAVGDRQRHFVVTGFSKDDGNDTASFLPTVAEIPDILLDSIVAIALAIGSRAAPIKTQGLTRHYDGGVRIHGEAGDGLGIARRWRRRATGGGRRRGRRQRLARDVAQFYNRLHRELFATAFAHGQDGAAGSRAADGSDGSSAERRTAGGSRGSAGRGDESRNARERTQAPSAERGRM